MEVAVYGVVVVSYVTLYASSPYVLCITNVIEFMSGVILFITGIDKTGAADGGFTCIVSHGGHIDELVGVLCVRNIIKSTSSDCVIADLTISGFASASDPVSVL